MQEENDRPLAVNMQREFDLFYLTDMDGRKGLSSCRFTAYFSRRLQQRFFVYCPHEEAGLFHHPSQVSGKSCMITLPARKLSSGREASMCLDAAIAHQRPRRRGLSGCSVPIIRRFDRRAARASCRTKIAPYQRHAKAWHSAKALARRRSDSAL